MKALKPEISGQNSHYQGHHERLLTLALSRMLCKSSSQLEFLCVFLMKAYTYRLAVLVMQIQTQELQ